MALAQQNALDTKVVLSVFDKIRSHGSRDGQQYHLEGITAFTDFDGYTVYLEDARVKLSFGFHNQYHFDYDNQQAFEQFLQKIEYIKTHY